jgi:hypothetical protein
MLASLKLAADFSRWCAGRRIGHPLFATHPTTLPFANGSMPALCRSIFATVDKMHGSKILCLLEDCGTQSGPYFTCTGAEVCNVLNQNFRE